MVCNMVIQLKARILQNGPPSDPSRIITAHPSEGKRERSRSEAKPDRSASRSLSSVRGVPLHCPFKREDDGVRCLTGTSRSSPQATEVSVEGKERKGWRIV